ncbi:hypothetical protein L873DRAFT_1791562 [Choiromyces venosus 120613-1]|uniref:Uncharacterized protein n=1 Tax=Choiromyces venosus 120613-1 TaxID=1336337 RepID=A0A3N4JS49_9PEZI|nr:hypothetical protein L873DRAFT_1791562 [Choiromyces venosus 120613-1]
MDMDMTSLSSNLPNENHSPEDPPDPEPGPSSTLLLQAFKQTALSVTNLYKAAANEAQRSRRDGRVEGYQDCLEDFLAFIDRIENRGDQKTLAMLRQWALGKRRKLGPGTGWKPKQKREDTGMEEAMDSDEITTPTNTDAERTETPSVASPLPDQLPTAPPAVPPPPQVPAAHTPQQPFNPLSRRSSPTHSRQPNPGFSFRSNLDLPRHVPPPTILDINEHRSANVDLYSPPTSPNLAAQKPIFHGISANSGSISGFRGVSRSPSASTMNKNQGTKRRFGSGGDFDFFDMAELEKMAMSNKRSRHNQ